MSKVFLAALAGSAAHIIASAHKLGGHGYEALVAPAMIDGIAIIGMVMRSKDFDDRTNRIGFKVQCVMGALSLAMNVYAARSLYGVLFGIAVVALFVLAEWLSDNIKSRKVAEQADAIMQAEATLAAEIARMAACAHPTTCTTTEQCTTKTEATAKRSKTVARKARQHKAETRALETSYAIPALPTPASPAPYGANTYM